MNVEANGFVLKNIQISGNRRLLTILTREYGKIVAILNQIQVGKNKSNLWSKPFTYSKFDIYKNKEYFMINRGTVTKSYYSLGEDVDKYIKASHIFEFTDKVMVENHRNQKQIDLLIDFLDIISADNIHINTIILGYKIKTLSINGLAPHIKNCLICGEKKDDYKFHIVEGGLICKTCLKEKISKNDKENMNEKLIYDCNFGIINVIRYILLNSLHNLKKLALEDSAEKLLKRIITDYFNHHFDVGYLKTEEFLK